MKRFKRDSASPAPTGTGGFKPEPTMGAPGRTNANPGGAPVRDAYAELPEGVLVFMEMLPSAHLFDGPLFKPDDIIECIRSANLPAPSGVPMGPGARRPYGATNRPRFMR